MPFVSGKVLLDLYSSANPNSPLTFGIKNIPVVIQDIQTFKGIGVYTNNDGIFSFANVPPGTYDIIECASYKPQYTAITSFTSAIVIETPLAEDPPINVIPSLQLPDGATKLNSLSPNIQRIIVSSSNVTNITFLDAPIREIHSNNPNVFLSHTDIVNITYGEYPYPTTPLTSPDTPDFNANYNLPGDYSYQKYANNIPTYGHYTVTNMITNNNFSSTWWNISDHTTGDEIGKMQICQSIDSTNPRIFYIKRNLPGFNYNKPVSETFYSLSFWVCNLVKNSTANVPRLRVNFVATGELPGLTYNLIYDTPQIAIPTWEKFTFVIPGTPTTYDLNLLYIGPSENGHAFAIDDIVYNELISSPTILFEKRCNQTYSIPGFELSYSLSFKNNGPQTIRNLIIKDTIPENTTAIANSLLINGEPKNFISNNSIEFTLPSLAQGNTILISYKVKINNNINANKILSPEANSSYDFLNPLSKITVKNLDSNSVSTTLNYADLKIVKRVDKLYAIPEDLLSYSISIKNSGTTTANFVTLVDTIPNNVSYVEDTFSINQLPIDEPPIFTRLPINIPINPNSTVTINFDVIINKDVSVNEISNSCTVEYNYTIYPNLPNIAFKASHSNIAKTSLRYVKLQGTESINKASVQNNEILTYTIYIENTGTIATNSVFLTCDLDENINFINGSVKINDLAVTTINTLINLPLPNIEPNSPLVLSFDARVINRPISLTNKNGYNIRYDYIKDPFTSEKVNGKYKIESTTIDIILPKANLLKYVIPSYADIGSIVFYFLIIENKTNTKINTLNLFDNVPSNTTFIPTSLRVDNVNVSSESNTAINITLENIEPDKSHVIVYGATINDISSNIRPIVSSPASANYNLDLSPLNFIEIFSETVTLPINRAILTVNATVDKINSYVSDVLTYTFTIDNTGTTSANNVMFVGALNENLSMIPNSLTIDGSPVIGSPNISSVPIGTIESLKSKVITFMTHISSLPQSGQLSILATINFDYTIDPDTPTNASNSISAVSPLTAVFSNITAEVIKSVDKNISEPSSILTYTLSINNPRSETLINIEFVDTIPQNTALITDSIFIDGVTVTSSTPIKAAKPSLNSSETSILTYKVRVNDNISDSLSISNIGYVKYQYRDALGNINTEGLNSNETNTTINIVPATLFRKFVNKSTTFAAQEMLYTLEFKNDSLKQLNNLNIIDTLPDNTTLVPGSLMVNDGLSFEENPLNIIINSLNPMDIAVVTYKVTVDYLRQSNIREIKNNAFIKYEYTDAYDTPTINRKTSNEVSTNITEFPLATFTKTVDKANSDITDILSYTLTFTNSTLRNISTVNIFDTLPDNTILVPNSLTVNGAPRSISGNPLSIALNNISPNDNVIVSYKIRVNNQSISINQINNIAYAGYYLDIDDTKIIGINSNEVITNINYANLQVIKTVNKTESFIGDKLEFQIQIINNGNSPAQSVVLIDNLESDLILTPNSITIDGALSTSQNLSNLNLIDINSGQSTSIRFNAVVNSQPTSNRLLNVAQVNYNYLISPGVIKSNSSTSNVTTTTISPSPIATFSKTVDKLTSSIGGYLTYSLVISNTRPEEITNIKFVDTIPENTTFVEGSMTINDTTLPKTTPPSATVSTLASNESATFKYRVLINENLVDTQSISNEGYVEYSYLDGFGDSKSVDLISNTVNTTLILPPSTTFTKVVNHFTAYLGDALSYTLTFKNNGPQTIFGITITDIIPDNTTLVPNSIKFNELVISDTNSITVTAVQLNPRESLVLTYKVLINYSAPNDKFISNIAHVKYDYITVENNSTTLEYDSNTVSTLINMLPAAIFSKQVNNSFAKKGSTLTYSLLFRNTTSKTITSLNFVDTIPRNSTFIPNSLLLNGNVVQPSDTSVLKIRSTSIAPNENVAIVYQANIDDTNNIINTIDNTAYCSYKFSSLQPVPIGVTSNRVSTSIRTTKLNVVKRVDKVEAYLYEILNFTIEITNIDNTTATNVVFSDNISNYLALDKNSIRVNTVTVRVDSVRNVLSINIPDISPNATSIITFSAKAITLPPSKEISNSAIVSYKYTVNPSLIDAESATSHSNAVTIKINDIAKATLIKNVNKLYAEKNNKLEYTLEFKNTTDRFLNSVFIVDTIPQNTTYTGEPIIIDNISVTPADNVIRLEFTQLPPNAKKTISYSVTINDSRSITGNITNMAYAGYTFSDFPSKINSIESNVVNTEIKYPELQIKKFVDKTTAYVNDNIKYTLEITNIGNITATNVYVVDNITNNVDLIENSIIRDGEIITVNPNLNFITVGTISVGQKVILQFMVTINSIPDSNIITNSARVFYSYIVDPNSTDKSQSHSDSNIVQTTVDSVPLAKLIKTVDKLYADKSEEITYNLIFENSSPQIISTAKIVDTLPDILDIISDSLTVDGIIENNSSNVINVNLSSLVPNEKSIISYKATIKNSALLTSPISNIAYAGYKLITPTAETIGIISDETLTFINTADISIEKAVNLTEAYVGNVLNYRITLINTGNTTAENVVVSDLLTSELSLVSDSLNINGRRILGVPDLSNIEIGAIENGKSLLLTFNAKISSLPLRGNIFNSANVSFKYKVNPSSQSQISKTNSSNNVTVRVDSLPEIRFTKMVNKKYADKNDELTYTIFVNNTGAKTLIKNSILDNLSPDTILIAGSLTINGIKSNEQFPIINLPDLNSDESIFISYRVKVSTTLDIIDEISNSASLNYSFIDINSREVDNSIISNTVSTKINNAKLLVNKEVEKEFLSLGTTENYKITITNNGNTRAYNINLTDELSENLEFVADSIVVGGVPISGVSPSGPLVIPALPPETSSVVTFRATVSNLPPSSIITNIATVHYNYIIDPELNIIGSDLVNSNLTENFIQATPSISFNKSVNKSFADKNEELKYTITIRNNGPQPIINLHLTDDIPPNTTFIENSLIIDGKALSGNLSSPGIALKNINKDRELTITYLVKVANGFNNINDISNLASLRYSFDNLTGNISTKTISSNITSTKINNANLNIIQSVNKHNSYVTDVLTYKTSIVNTGNTIANNVFIYENIPFSATVIPGSVIIDNIAASSDNLFGISLGSIPPNKTIEISFMVRINSLSASNEIVSFSTASYNYTVNPQTPNSISGNKVSNNVTTRIINLPTVTFNKGVDKIFATNNDILTYTLSIENVSTEVLSILNITDIIPDNTTLIPDSLTVDGVPKNVSGNTITVDLTSIPNASVVNISYKVTVNLFSSTFNKITNIANASYRIGSPSASTIRVTSNSVTTEIKNCTLRVEKIVDKPTAKINDILTYIISISNIGNTVAYDVTLNDNLPYYVAFVKDSLTLDGVVIPKISDISSINIGSVDVNDNVIILFKVRIIKLPAADQISNIAHVRYNYNIRPDQVEQGVHSSNIVTTTMQYVPTVILLKDVNKTSVDNNEELIYSLTLRNNGPQTITNINIIDTIPDNTIRVDSNLLIDNINTPSTGNVINKLIPRLSSSGEVILSYKVKSTSKGILDNEILNSAFSSYQFVNSNNRLSSSSITSNTVSTNLTFAKITSYKSVNKTHATINEILNYVIIVNNIGTSSAKDIVVIDNLSPSLALVPDSLNINGGFISGTPDLTALEIGDILPGQSIAISFSAKIISIPNSRLIQNISRFDYKYAIGSKGSSSISSNINLYADEDLERLINATSYSNLISVRVDDFAQIEFTKSVDKLSVVPGDILSYTLTVKNVGFTPIINGILVDTIPDNTTFVENSLIIDGVVSEGNLNSPGINLKNLSVNTETSIAYSVNVNKSTITPNTITNSAHLKYSALRIDGTIESLSSISNEVKTRVKESTKLIATKFVDKSYAQKNEILTYTILITNLTNYEARNITFIDKLTTDVTFIDNSLIINDTPVSGLLSLSNYPLINIKSKETTTIVFKVKASSIPKSKVISNSVLIKYSLRDIPFEIESNIVTTEIISCIVDNYAHYLLSCKLKACIKGTIPLQNILINGNSISNINNEIILSKNYTFKAYWSVVVKTNKGYHNIKAMLTLNDTIIPGSISISKNTNNCPNTITFNGTALFRTESSKNIIKFAYDSCNTTFYIIGASLKIFQLD